MKRFRLILILLVTIYSCKKNILIKDHYVGEWNSDFEVNCTMQVIINDDYTCEMYNVGWDECFNKYGDKTGKIKINDNELKICGYNFTIINKPFENGTCEDGKTRWQLTLESSFWYGSQVFDLYKCEQYYYTVAQTLANKKINPIAGWM